MIQLFSVGLKGDTADFRLDGGFKDLKVVKEAAGVLSAHQDELIVIANELLDVLKLGARKYEVEEYEEGIEEEYEEEEE